MDATLNVVSLLAQTNAALPIWYVTVDLINILLLTHQEGRVETDCIHNGGSTTHIQKSYRKAILILVVII